MTDGFPLTAGIVVAAGSGTRLGQAIPKAFVPVRGISMVRRSIEILRSSGVVSSVIVTVPAGFPFDSELRAVGSFVSIVYGGDTRQQSVYRALEHCRSHLSGVEFVAVHDAARCLMPPAVVRRVVEAAWQCSAATAAVPVVDTLRRVGGSGTITGEVDREALWQIQTPQVFLLDLLWSAHQRATAPATDDASLVSPLHPVQIVEGSRYGFKITTPEDLAFAEQVAVGEPLYQEGAQ